MLRLEKFLSPDEMLQKLLSNSWLYQQFYKNYISSTFPKGQLISKSPFGVFKLTKKTNEIFVRISALASKKRSNQKNKGTLYH